MTLEDTYNIHKEINCVLPFFKSKRLCKKGIHNYHLGCRVIEKPITLHKEKEFEVIQVKREYKAYWKCYCCGKEEEWSD